jgi:cytochrome c553
MSKFRVLIAAALSAAALFVMGAQPLAAQSADAAVLAGSCANCHGTDGRSPGVIIPSIAGRPDAVLRDKLKAFKADTAPPGTTIMHRLVKGYSDEQLDSLAAYFSKMEAKPEAKADTKSSGKGGKK